MAPCYDTSATVVVLFYNPIKPAIQNPGQWLYIFSGGLNHARQHSTRYTAHCTTRTRLCFKYHLAGPNNILEKMYLEALCHTQIPQYGCAISVIQFQHYSRVPSRTWKRSIQRFVITEKAPTWGLLRDCEIFANFRKAFVVSSSAQTIQPAPTPMRRERRRNGIQLLPARPVGSSL